jgi:uncharacterized protein YndB with AHSA1/START domain
MKHRPALAILGFAFSLSAAAEVETAREGFFSIKSVVLVEVKPAVAWKSLAQVSKWWDPAHTWSGAARNLVLEARAGGCFCEKLEKGGSVQHARVVFAQPGQTLRLDGALGPLQEMPVTGVLTFALAPDASGTRITMTYRVSGALSMDAAKLAPLVDQVMTAQLERLRGFIKPGP